MEPGVPCGGALSDPRPRPSRFQDDVGFEPLGIFRDPSGLRAFGANGGVLGLGLQPWVENGILLAVSIGSSFSGGFRPVLD